MNDKNIPYETKTSSRYAMYMGSRRAMYNDIAASTSVIFRPWLKNSLGQGRALWNFVASDEKNSPCRGYIVVYYSPPKSHICIKYIANGGRFL